MPFLIVKPGHGYPAPDVTMYLLNPNERRSRTGDVIRFQSFGPFTLKKRCGIFQLKSGQIGWDEHSRTIYAAIPDLQENPEKAQSVLHDCCRQGLEMTRRLGTESLLLRLPGGLPERAVEELAKTIDAFLRQHEMTVFLEVPEKISSLLNQELRKDVERYLDRHTLRFSPLDSWDLPSPKPFLPEEDSAAEYACEASCAPTAPMPPMAAPSAAAKYSPGKAAKSSRSEAPRLKTAAPSLMGLEELLSRTDAGFSETLLKLIDQTGKKDSAIYTRANLSRQHFSKIRNNPDYKPTKPTALALAVALELNLEQTRDLIGRAGYALTSSSKFDLIVMYFIEKKIYDLVTINTALYEFDQSLLGS